MAEINIHMLKQEDIPIIVEAFAAASWPKPASIFEQYLQEQQLDQRIVWVAYCGDEFAGYGTLKWQSDYPYFRERNIPEINDLNVLPKFQKQGIGSALLDLAEHTAIEKSDIIGIGVGLYADYGNAQTLYVKRGYIPDGNGLTYEYKAVEPGSQVKVDDVLLLWMVKKK